MKNKFYNTKKIKRYFTLIELVVTMTLFLIIFAIIGRFYNTATNVISSSGKHTMIFENAKIAMDLMSREIQCIYYESGKIPFWHWRPSDLTSPPNDWGNYRNELLAFVSVTNFPQNSESSSKISEIKYQRHYPDNHDDSNDGWLRRSVTGNKKSDSSDNAKWNYYNNLEVGYTTDLYDGTDTPKASFTADSSSCEDYQKVIPYVTDLTFTCFDDKGDIIIPDNNESTAPNQGEYSFFPFSIEISLSLMDKNSWLKWIELNGNINPINDTEPAKSFRKKHERTFKKTVLIGNRGQYE